MKTFVFLLITFFVLSFQSCNNDHLVNDHGYMDKVKDKFNERREIFQGREGELFSIIDSGLNKKESEAMQFLIAYMPLNDLADYSGSFYLVNVRLSLQARENTLWGNKIPEDIFLHYVLPPRVNNENLDSFRIAYYNEIHERINDAVTIEKAALEINHWCHEKVSYQPADIRTSAPMATVLSARGRCGEESTFTVAALRTAGIPARQIYTPRWAHCDDNHAWVEVWVDGEWKYLGACEPEPVLDRGWFTEPARRAMLTHTKAFGLYRGNGKVVKKTENFAEINTLSKYARTKALEIKVIDPQHNVVDNAVVEPSLYNYAEFYPLAKIITRENGQCSFETGLGDLLVWAHKDGKFGFEKVNVDEADTVIIILGNKDNINDYYEFDLQAPVQHIPYSDTIPGYMKSSNPERLIMEDSIRNAYVNTWMNGDDAVKLARANGLDKEIVKNIISRSMGNYVDIARLITDTPEEYNDILIKLLGVISDKDLRDTKSYVLMDHLVNAGKYHNPDNHSDEIYIRYVLNPRISFEILTTWRSFIYEYFDNDLSESIITDPYAFARWIKENIKLANEENYYNVPVSPEGVLETGYADLLSAKILFIAGCRSYGIPARLEKGTIITQFYRDNTWHDVFFSDEKYEKPGDAYLSFSYEGGLPVPEYYIHFTIARFENGRYVTLDYDYNRKITLFDDSLTLPEGSYMLVTGNRTNGSTVLSSIKFFDLEAGKKRTLNVKLRKEMKPARILNKIDFEQNFVDGNINKKLIAYSEKGMVIIWIDHDKEPSKHILNDLPHVKNELDELGCQFIFLSDPSTKSASYLPDEFEGLPEKTLFGFDENLDILNSIYGKSYDKVQLPVVVYADENGNVYYKSEGYRIGIGEQILKSIIKVKL